MNTRNFISAQVLPLFFLFMISCQSESKKNGDGVVTEHTVQDTLKKVTVIDNIPYRPGNSKAWTLDLAIPANFGSAPMPAIVIVHGGGWRAGSKQADVYRTLLLNYAFQGYVTASVEYRLHDEAPFPACVEDVKCAVRWMRAHAEKYNVDPKRIGAYGHSAGAHIVLMLAMSSPAAGLEGDGGWNEFSSRPDVVIGGATPTVPGARHEEWNKPGWWPEGYISEKVPPMLLIHGTADDLVPVGPVDAFVEKMKAAGAPIEYLRIEGGDHGVAYEKKLEISKPAMDAFFEKNLKNTSH